MGEEAKGGGACGHFTTREALGRPGAADEEVVKEGSREFEEVEVFSSHW